MKKICFLLLVIVCCWSCNEEKNRVEKAKVLYERIQTFGYSTIIEDSTIRLCREAIELLRGTNENNLSGNIYSFLGELLQRNNSYPQAKQAFKEAFKCYLNSGDNNKALKQLGNLCTCYREPDSIKYYLKTNRHLFDQTKDTLTEASIYNWISQLYAWDKKYEEALNYNQKAFNMSNDTVYLLKRGELFQDAGIKDSSILYLNIVAQNPAYAFYAYIDLSQLYDYSNDPVKAKYYREKASKVSTPPNDLSAMEKEKAELIQLIQAPQINKEYKKKFHNWAIMGSLIIIISGVSFLIYFRCNKRKITDVENKLSEQQQLLLLQEEERVAKEKIMTDTLRNSLIYIKVEALFSEQKNQAVLTYDEQEELSDLVEKVFVDFIVSLRRVCPELKLREIIYCCLAKAGANTQKCAICMGVSYDTARQQKKRIKTKLVSTNEGRDFFVNIFSEME